MERLSLQSEFDVLSMDHTSELLMKTRQVYCEQGAETSRLLAFQLIQTLSHLIPQIQTSAVPTTDFSDEFKDIFVSLYVSESTADPSHLMVSLFCLMFQL